MEPLDLTNNHTRIHMTHTCIFFFFITDCFKKLHNDFKRNYSKITIELHL